MGCINCKPEISERITCYERKKQSRWRPIVGVEAKGTEFNAQVGLVHIGDERLQLQNQDTEDIVPRVTAGNVPQVAIDNTQNQITES